MTSTAPSIDALRNVATALRIDSVRSTSEAGSGHPTTCLSAADIVATLFFAEMRFDPHDPRNPDADRFVLSKGHAAPLLYAAWAEAGAFDRAELLRRCARSQSDLEGHPTPRLPFVDVATGSLGQGICAAVGIALNARRIGSDYRTYVLARRRREPPRDRSGKPRTSPRTTSSTTSARSPTSTRLGQSRETQWRPRRGRVCARAGGRSAGTRSSSTATISRRCSSARRRSAPHDGPADDDRGARR